MYESPIEIIQTQMQMQMDEGILKAVQDCRIMLKDETISLLNRHQAENERLKDLLKYEEAKYDRCAKQFYKAGVKEFAERLKEKQRTYICDEYAYEYIPSIEIDVLLAEMVGGENA